MKTYSKKVFLTSNVFTAFVDRAHPKQQEAAAYFRYFAQNEYILFTDTASVLEAYNSMYKDMSPSLAKDFLRTLIISNINIIYPEEADSKAAIKALMALRSTDVTYTQAQVAVLANKRGIMQICSLEYLHPLFDQTVFYLPL